MSDHWRSNEDIAFLSAELRAANKAADDAEAFAFDRNQALGKAQEELAAERDLRSRIQYEYEQLLSAAREALGAMVYVHSCNCGDGIPDGACARCRAVKLLGFDPGLAAETSRPHYAAAEEQA